MKTLLLMVSIPLLVGSLLIVQTAPQPASINSRSVPILDVDSPGESTPVALCGSTVDGQINRLASGKFIGPLPGWGRYSYPISTRQDSAQFYFDQGLTMYYSYHMKESMASFKEAARLDSTCAMAWWGQALAGGPYYNAAHSYQLPAEMPAILARMNALSADASPKEKRLIQVMTTRYSADPTDSQRSGLNQAYANATRQLITEYGDPDSKMLYVDAVMLLHAWDFWHTDGRPKAWTQEVIDLSKSVLATHPDHPAALHYYIHLTEASHQPQVALANADKLKSLFPGVAHMVHMASHEYQRNGLYPQGVQVNDRADANLVKYDSMAPHLNLVKHSPHYFAVQTYCALTGGMYQVSVSDALRCRQSVSPVATNTYDQYLYMLPSLSLVRLGKWNEVLATEPPTETWTYAVVLDHFSKGMALVGTGKLTQAQSQLRLLLARLQDPILEKRRIPFNAPLPVARIAGHILEASIQFATKQQPQALVSLQRAIDLEDQLIYTEPADWPLPARQFLGAYLLKMQRPQEAETVYRQDLIHNPGNGWSLVGLHQALTKQGKKARLAQVEAGFKKAFSGAEQIPPSSIY
ncbi:tetratricopeptide repeat protein [Larkinella insperata]|uniref:Tetratricopeptide repeat protein n=1 Tax=Larkinella insperata TaxID=332158 RepID=A0ABW3Q7B9_9BACT